MADIKSAYEIAMEKVDKIPKATGEELLKWKYTPEGEKLAAKYLKQDADLVAELSHYKPDVAGYVISGAVSILVRNINLPGTELIKKTNKLVMDGIKAIKKDKTNTENLFSQIRRLFSHYTEQGEQQRRQAYQQLRASFTAKVQQALQKQMGSSAADLKIDVEKQPQFQEEWHKLLHQLDSQYIKLLEEYKQQLTESN
jgi:ribosomal protein S15P/S13E